MNIKITVLLRIFYKLHLNTAQTRMVWGASGVLNVLYHVNVKLTKNMKTVDNSCIEQIQKSPSVNFTSQTVQY